MDIRNIKEKDCCGCSACVAVCPVNAIQMKINSKGFNYPQIDTEKCISCEKCYHVCSNAKMLKKECLHVYAAKNKDKEVLRKSSSGGVSHGLMEKIINNGGVVYGVSYDSDCCVVTSRADTIDDCEKFYGSKYVQADPKSTFTEVSADLKNGKEVLYIGTSCHVAGLYSYLKAIKTPIEKLYTVDLICHGVPSPLLFKDYISFLKKNKKFVKFDFRTKYYPWGYGSKNYGCTIRYANKNEIDTDKSKLFLKLFFSNNCLREACHNCVFAGASKPADFTIADYWGVKDEHPSFYSENGVSAILVHSEKGERFLHSCESLEMIESSPEKVQKKQGNMHAPSPKGSDSDAFWQLYFDKGFLAVAKRYGGYSFKTRCKHKIQQLLNIRGH